MTKDFAAIASQLTDTVLACQLIMIDIPEKMLSEKFIKTYEKTPWGGIILFTKNIESEKQVRKLTSDLASLSSKNNPKLPVFIGADHEGGIVTRFLFDSVVPLCGNMALGACGDSEDSYTSGLICAQDMKSLGFNTNFAPVADVNSNPANPIIGARSFGEEPKACAELSCAFAKGLRDGGIIPCAKHFPGHGDVSLDSHTTMPVISKTLQELEECEIIPFRSLIEMNIEMIMTSHINFKALEENPHIPATLSRSILTRYLREKLGFNGVIITDSMSMKGIRDYFGYSQAAVMALSAGADMIMLCGSEKEKNDSVKAICKALAEGTLQRKELEKSFVRLAYLRESYFNKKEIKKIENPFPAMKEITQKTITAVKMTELIPFTQQDNILIVTPELFPPSPQGEASKQPTLPTYLKKYVKKCETFAFNLKAGSFKEKELAEKAQKADKIVLCLYANGYLNDLQKKITETLKVHIKKLIVLSLSSPYIIKDINWLENYICCYNPGEISMDAAAEVMAGKKKASGKLPVTLPL